MHDEPSYLELQTLQVIDTPLGVPSAHEGNETRVSVTTSRLVASGPHDLHASQSSVGAKQFAEFIFGALERESE